MTPAQSLKMPIPFLIVVVITCDHPNLTAMMSRQYYNGNTSIATYSHCVPIS